MRAKCDLRAVINGLLRRRAGQNRSMIFFRRAEGRGYTRLIPYTHVLLASLVGSRAEIFSQKSESVDV